MIISATNAAGTGSRSSLFERQRTARGAPRRQFLSDPASGNAPLAVHFDASSSNDPNGLQITNYQWDFGDGQTGSGVTVSHTYTSPGSYNAQLTVTNTLGITGAEILQVVVIQITPAELRIGSVIGAAGNNSPGAGLFYTFPRTASRTG